MNTSKTIWTIGHSTRSTEEFMALLHSFQISVLADVRNFPGSRRYPHFNKEVLAASLAEEGIKYVHMKDLGGRRTSTPGSINNRWRNAAFRGYADYMQTSVFMRSVEELEAIAMASKAAYMCSEAVWWSCHRALLSDYLKVRGWEVYHIMGLSKAPVHPFTSAARIVDGQLSYTEPTLF